MNFLFISPNYPVLYQKFCIELHKQGCKVFGIGDAPYASLDQELRSVLTEYVHVPNLGDNENVAGAAKNLAAAHGSFIGLESNNEFWLELDAGLRQDLGVEGVRPDQIEYYTHKSKMKIKFASQKIATVPFVVARSKEAAEAFANKYGYPIFAKPNRGVGARSVCKISDSDALNDFFRNPLDEDFIFEIFIEGKLYSYDGLVDKSGNIVFEAAHHFETPIDELKRTNSECIYHTLQEIPTKLRAAGVVSVKAFEVKGRFVHIEFFELTKPIKNVGEVGDFVAIEANMRPGGGLTLEMMNAAKGVNLFEVWAKCMTNGSVDVCKLSSNFCCTNVGRHINRRYLHSIQEIHDKFKHNVFLSSKTCDEENPFGNFEILGKFKSSKESKVFSDFATEV